MRIGFISAFSMLFAICGIESSATNVENPTNESQQQVDKAFGGSNLAKSQNKIKRRKRQRKFGTTQGTENPVHPTECKVCKAHSEGAAVPENTKPTDTKECPVCEAHSLVPNGSGEVAQGTKNPVPPTECKVCKAHKRSRKHKVMFDMKSKKRKEILSASTNTETAPTNDSTQCETCKKQELTPESLKGLENLEEDVSSQVEN